MRVAWAAALLLIAGCSTPASQTQPANPVAVVPLVPCADPRPELCTMEYVPACASLVEGGFRTYASACNACADEAVAGYQSGACKE